MFKKLITAKYRICVLARNVVNIDVIDNWLNDFGVDKRVDTYLLANLKYFYTKYFILAKKEIYTYDMWRGSREKRWFCYT